MSIRQGRRGVVGWLLATTLLLQPAVGSASRDAPRSDPSTPTFGLGGTSDLSPNAVLPFSIDAPSQFETAVFVRSTSSVPIGIEMSSNLPTGIFATALIDLPITLQPGEGRRIPFSISSERGLSTGLFRGLVTFNATYDGPLPTGISFLPGFAAIFRIQTIGGAPARVTIQSVNADDEQPARGNLSVYFLSNTGSQTLIEQIDGATLVRDLPAGRYRARFRISGLIDQSEEFEVVAGETKTVTIRIRGITFLQTIAQPIRRDGEVEAARLVLVVRNNLRRFVGPVTFDVEIRRNGELVESFRMAELPELPEGATEQQSTYIPPDGFKRGTWTFQFSVSTPAYTVKAPFVQTIQISLRVTPLGALLLVTALALLAALGWLGRKRWWLAARRRREEEEEEVVVQAVRTVKQASSRARTTTSASRRPAKKPAAKRTADKKAPAKKQASKKQARPRSRPGR